MSHHDRYRVGRKLPQILIVFCVLIPVASAARSIGRQNLEVLGLTLSQNEVGDAESRLGQAPVFHSPDSHFAKRCYASGQQNGPVLIIEDWSGTLVGFQIVRPMPSDVQKCTPTPVVTNEISTGGGLKLGLTERDVVKLLGTPDKRSKNTFVYHEDVEKKGSGGLFEFTDLRIGFADSNVVSIHVVHTVRD